MVNDEIFALRKNAGASNQKHLLGAEQGTNTNSVELSTISFRSLLLTYDAMAAVQ